MRKGYQRLKDPGDEEKKPEPELGNKPESSKTQELHGRNIWFILVMAALFTAVLTLFLAILLKTNFLVVPNLNLPGTIALEEFSAGDMSYSKHQFATGYVLEMNARDSVTFGPLTATSEMASVNGSLVSKDVVIGNENLMLSESQLHVWYEDPVTLFGSLRVFGVMAPTSMTFGTFEIRDKVLTNKAPAAEVLNEEPVELFKVSGGMIAVVRGGRAVVYRMNGDEQRPVPVWEREVRGVERIESLRKVFVFAGEEEVAVDCRDSECTEVGLKLDEFDGEWVVDGFGTRWELDRGRCVVIEGDVEHALNGGCENAKVGVTRDLKVFVVQPMKRVVRCFDGDEVEEWMMQSNVADRNYEIVPNRAAIMFLNDGEFTFEAFDV